MSLSRGKCWYSNNCLHYVKRTLPLANQIALGHTFGALTFVRQSIGQQVSLYTMCVNQMSVGQMFFYRKAFNQWTIFFLLNRSPCLHKLSLTVPESSAHSQNK